MEYDSESDEEEIDDLELIKEQLKKMKNQPWHVTAV